MNGVFLSLGSNVGKREDNLNRALQLLECNGVRVVARSSLYETAPRDVLHQPWFLNMAVRVETDLDPIQLLGTLQCIERELGRDRTAQPIAKGPRTLDIDILLFDDATMDTEELTVPHPRMWERRFVLEPLSEIAPELDLSSRLSAVSDQPMRKFNPHSQDPAVL